MKVMFFLLIGLGVFLRLTGLDVHSLWFDEAATLCAAEAADPVAVLRQDMHPPLSHWLYRVWLSLPGLPATDAWLRLPSALAGVASLLLGAWLLSLWLPSPAARIASAILALSPFALGLAHEVRMYGFVHLATVVALLGVEAWRRGRTALGCAAIALGTACAFGCHYLGALATLAVGGMLLVDVVWRRASIARAAVPVAAATLGIAVWLPWVLAVVPRQRENPWGYAYGSPWRGLVELPARYVLLDVSVVEGLAYHALTLVGVLLLASAGLHVVRTAWRRAPADLGVALAWLLPIAGLAALTPVATPAVDARALVVGMIGCVASIGAGLGLVPWRRVRVGLVVVVLAGCLGLTLSHRAGNRREGFRAACADVAQAWQPGDAIVAVTGTPEVFSQHAARHYFRDRPELVASLRELPTMLAAGAAWPPAPRLHVVYRVAEYAKPFLEGLLARCVVERSSPVRFRVQSLILRPR